MTITSGTPLEIVQVQKSYGKFQALKSLSATIESGTIVGILGPSGSGKTTLIRIIAGLLAPTRGYAKVLGRTMPDRLAAARIGYMPQNYALYSDLTVRENLAFYAGMNRIKGTGVIDSVLEEINMTHRAKSPVHTLSGGEQRTTSLAAALIHDPDLLLLDEPTVGLDPRLRLRLWDDFRRRAGAGKTLLVTSHVMDEMEHCDKILLLSNGLLVAADSPAQLKARAGKPSLEEAFIAFTESAGG